VLKLIDHPIAAHIVTHLRDKTTKPATFRTLTYQLSLLLAVEATRDLETEVKVIETPLEATEGTIVTHEPLVVVPVLRAGLGMVQPFLDVFPDVSVGYLGLERDHATAEARHYYSKLPVLVGRRVFVVDPMLATGGSASMALTMLKENGAVRPKLVCIVASPEGCARIERDHPDVEVHVAALDSGLNAKKYILPGLGDFGDRLFGT
jgi:uracil phosphoribosyltransferase